MAVVGPSLCSVCQGPSGDVDWWVAFKYPKVSDYAYADSQNSQLARASDNLSDIKCPLWKTLGKGSATSGASMYYNDETPEGAKTSSRAHSKGVWMSDPDFSGFWLIHSVPRFPLPTGTGFPDDELIYGQSFLCISITNSTDWQTVAKHILINFPLVYSSSLPSWFLAEAPAMGYVKDSAPPSGTPDQDAAPIGAGFMSFAKSKAWDSDLYGDFVAPTLKISMLVESWGRPYMPPHCDGSYHVNDITELNLLGTSFKDTEDHSKYGISTSASMAVVCIGDINRMTSQRKRGGGTACFRNQALWTALKQSVQSTDSC